jgi:sarcosine oxidase, subunit gamma
VSRRPAPARDPVAGRAAAMARLAETSGGVRLSTVPFLAQVDLRLDPELAGRAPYPLALDPNTAAETGDRTALWLGPDEWLILGPPGAAGAIVAELEAALHGLHRSVVDVSANRVALELSGPRRSELLSSGCSLDLHPRAWRSGMCAQSLYARIPIVLHERSEDVTRLLVRPSYAEHLLDLLLDAAGGLGSDGATTLP